MINIPAKFEVSILTCPEIWSGSQNSKNRSHDRSTTWGLRWPHVWIPRHQFAYSGYNFHGATM